jgi:hypothetical protein
VRQEPVNLWKHSEKTDDICIFNEAVRNILHLRELHKQIDETVLKAYGWELVGWVEERNPTIMTAQI